MRPLEWCPQGLQTSLQVYAMVYAIPTGLGVPDICEESYPRAAVPPHDGAAVLQLWSAASHTGAWRFKSMCLYAPEQETTASAIPIQRVAASEQKMYSFRDLSTPPMSPLHFQHLAMPGPRYCFTDVAGVQGATVVSIGWPQWLVNVGLLCRKF